jgi:hypothetical protein
MVAFANNMFMRWSLILLPVFLACEPVAFAQDAYAPADTASPNVAQAHPAFSQQELDQMLAPIALYPDPLLSQILMASTYPLEVVEAARWSRANPNLSGDDAVRATQQTNWDPSVKSLVAFPRILQMMDEKLDWTERLGDAFLAQQAQVMDTVQALRQKAYAVGNLRSNDQVRVDTDGQIIIIAPASPEVIYVPYYDPWLVYGAWWWPDYPPIYWAPWPGYYVQSGFAWGVGIFITTGFFFGDCDWHHHRVNVVNVNNFYYKRMMQDGRRDRPVVNSTPGAWHHDPDHRRGIPYRDVSLRNQYGRTAASPESRRNFRGYDQPSVGQPSPGEGGRRGPDQSRGVEQTRPEPQSRPETQPRQERDTRPDTQSHPENRTRPEPQPHSEPQPRPDTGGGSTNRQYERNFPARQSEPRVVSPPKVEARPPAFEGIGRGQEVRSYGQRGHSSFEGAAQSPSSPQPQIHFENSHGDGGARRSR